MMHVKHVHVYIWLAATAVDKWNEILPQNQTGIQQITWLGPSFSTCYRKVKTRRAAPYLSLIIKAEAVSKM
jgi:hypothetical protein